MHNLFIGPVNGQDVSLQVTPCGENDAWEVEWDGMPLGTVYLDAHEGYIAEHGESGSTGSATTLMDAATCLVLIELN